MTATNDLSASAHARVLSAPVEYAGEDIANDLSIYTDAKETDVTTTRYEIKTGPEHHNGTRPWMALASTVTVDCKSVGARCYYDAVTTSPAELEDALEADHDVIEFSVVTEAIHCECGAWSGERCEWSGPIADTVTVEFMPEASRTWHRAAGNSGIYPHNGACRIRVERACADRMIESDGDWCTVVA